MTVNFTNPPRIGHHPPHLDGRKYKLGWDFRKAGVRREDIHDRDEFAGWFDADNAIRLGRDIGQHEGSER